MPLFYARWGWALAFVTLGCAASDPGKRPGIIAHRGVALETPENTLPAVQKAIELGCAMAEIDLRYTSDGEVILMHDGTLERATMAQGGSPGRVWPGYGSWMQAPGFQADLPQLEFQPCARPSNWREERSSSTSI